MNPFYRLSADAVSRVVALVLFVLLCVSVTRWVLTLAGGQPLPLPADARVARVEPAAGEAARTLFGGERSVGHLANVQLKGVIAPTDSGTWGSAVLVIGGLPAEVFRAGREIAPRLKLVEVRKRSVLIERDGSREELRLPDAPGAGGGAPGVQAPPEPPGMPTQMPVPMPVPGANEAGVQPPPGGPHGIPHPGVNPGINPGAPNLPPGAVSP